MNCDNTLERSFFAFSCFWFASFYYLEEPITLAPVGAELLAASFGSSQKAVVSGVSSFNLSMIASWHLPYCYISETRTSITVLTYVSICSMRCSYS